MNAHTIQLMPDNGYQRLYEEREKLIAKLARHPHSRKTQGALQVVTLLMLRIEEGL